MAGLRHRIPLHSSTNTSCYSPACVDSPTTPILTRAREESRIQPRNRHPAYPAPSLERSASNTNPSRGPRHPRRRQAKDADESERKEQKKRARRKASTQTGSDRRDQAFPPSRALATRSRRPQDVQQPPSASVRGTYASLPMGHDFYSGATLPPKYRSAAAGIPPGQETKAKPRAGTLDPRRAPGLTAFSVR